MLTNAKKFVWQSSKLPPFPFVIVVGFIISTTVCSSTTFYPVASLLFHCSSPVPSLTLTHSHFVYFDFRSIIFFLIFFGVVSKNVYRHFRRYSVVRFNYNFLLSKIFRLRFVDCSICVVVCVDVFLVSTGISHATSTWIWVAVFESHITLARTHTHAYTRTHVHWHRIQPNTTHKSKSKCTNERSKKKMFFFCLRRIHWFRIDECIHVEFAFNCVWLCENDAIAMTTTTATNATTSTATMMMMMMKATTATMIQMHRSFCSCSQSNYKLPNTTTPHSSIAQQISFLFYWFTVTISEIVEFVCFCLFFVILSLCENKLNVYGNVWSISSKSNCSFNHESLTSTLHMHTHSPLLQYAHILTHDPIVLFIYFFVVSFHILRIVSIQFRRSVNHGKRRKNCDEKKKNEKLAFTKFVLGPAINKLRNYLRVYIQQDEFVCVPLTRFNSIRSMKRERKKGFFFFFWDWNRVCVCLFFSFLLLFHSILSLDLSYE